MSMLPPPHRRVAAALAIGSSLLALHPAPLAAAPEDPAPAVTASDAEVRWAAAVASANEAWLRDMYDVILQRSADNAGLDYWLGVLPAGGDAVRESVTQRFLFSREGAQGEVDRAYGELLGRAAEPGGRAFWTDFLQSRPVTVLRSNLIASNERFLAAGSTENWLDGVYVELLERHVDAGGRGYWIDQMARGRSRYSVVSAIYHSPEGLGFRVDALYDQVLGRAPTAGERQAGMAVILTLNERRLRGRLLASDEYYEQFLTSALAGLGWAGAEVGADG